MSKSRVKVKAKVSAPEMAEIGSHISHFKHQETTALIRQRIGINQELELSIMELAELENRVRSTKKVIAAIKSKVTAINLVISSR